MIQIKPSNSVATSSTAPDPIVLFDRDALRLRRIDYVAGEMQTPHHHDFASVTLVLRGDCQEVSEYDNHLSQTCTVLIKPPHVDHANVYGDRGTASLQISFAPRALPAFPLGDACRHLEGGPPAAKMLALLRATAHADPQALAPLILDALNTVAAYSNATAKEAPDWVEVLSRTIHSEPAESFSVARLAEHVGMHPVSMARAFRRHRACSITEYVRRARILRASRRIATHDCSLADLAIESGFADQPHFTRAFRTELGCTPGEFRRLVV